MTDGTTNQPDTHSKVQSWLTKALAITIALTAIIIIGAIMADKGQALPGCGNGQAQENILEAVNSLGINRSPFVSIGETNERKLVKDRVRVCDSRIYLENGDSARFGYQIQWHDKSKGLFRVEAFMFPNSIVRAQ